jgi:predicted nucleotidyltransferase
LKLSKIVGYVENALAFALSDDELFVATRAVWLFGSSVRGEITAKSDVDVFFDCREKDSKLVASRAQVALGQFYKSQDSKKWRLFGIKNPISIHAGELKRWKLRTSVYSEGLLMFAKAAMPEEYESKILIVLEMPKDKAKYMQAVRELYGRAEYKTPGPVQQAGGLRLSSNVAVIPREAFPKIRELLDGLRISYRIFEFLARRE